MIRLNDLLNRLTMFKRPCLNRFLENVREISLKPLQLQFIPVDELSHICQLALARLGGREGRQQHGGAGRHAVACSHGVSEDS